MKNNRGMSMFLGILRRKDTSFEQYCNLVDLLESRAGISIGGLNDRSISIWKELHRVY